MAKMQRIKEIELIQEHNKQINQLYEELKQALENQARWRDLWYELLIENKELKNPKVEIPTLEQEKTTSASGG